MKGKQWEYSEKLHIPEQGYTGRYRIAEKHPVTGEPMIELEQVIEVSHPRKEKT